MGMGDKIVKKLEELKGVATQAVVAPGQGLSAGSQEDTVSGAIPLSSWMVDIPDDVLVTALSIPGTHDSGCIDGPLGLAKTQNLDLAEQLNSGIRFLDIRLARYQDDLLVHHDVIIHGKKL